MSWRTGKVVRWAAEEDAAVAHAWDTSEFVAEAACAAAEACPRRTQEACRMRASWLGVKLGSEKRRKNAVGRVARLAAKTRASEAEIIAMRRRGLSIAEIADQGGVFESQVHAALAGQPRRLRCRGDDIGERAL